MTSAWVNCLCVVNHVFIACWISSFSLWYPHDDRRPKRMEHGNLVPRVFSLSNMAAAGEKTLAHSRNHVTDLSTESGNLFKMAAKIKSERIWVRGLETGEKQTKWRQRQTQEKLKIWKNALTSHRNTVEWYSDLIFCSMTFICFKPERSSVHGT